MIVGVFYFRGAGFTYRGVFVELPVMLVMSEELAIGSERMRAELKLFPLQLCQCDSFHSLEHQILSIASFQALREYCVKPEDMHRGNMGPRNSGTASTVAVECDTASSLESLRRLLFRSQHLSPWHWASVGHIRH